MLRVMKLKAKHRKLNKNINLINSCYLMLVFQNKYNYKSEANCVHMNPISCSVCTIVVFGNVCSYFILA